jgi:hypothetical protein
VRSWSARPWWSGACPEPRAVGRLARTARGASVRDVASAPAPLHAAPGERRARVSVHGARGARPGRPPRGAVARRAGHLLRGRERLGQVDAARGLAAAVGLPAVGSSDVAFDPTLAPARALARHLRLAWRVRTTRGFFLRAEDFFGFAKRLTQLRAELEARAAEVREEYRAQDRSAHALGLALGPLRGSLAEMERRYGADPRRALARRELPRAVPGAAGAARALPARRARGRALARSGSSRCWRCCATRWTTGAVRAGDALAAAAGLPGARLYSFDEAPPTAVEWDALEHVRLTRDFLAAPERFLRHL